LLPGLAVPTRLEGFVARANIVVRVDTKSPFSCLFDAQGEPRTDCVFIGFPDQAGVDSAYWAMRESDGATVLVLVQCKAGNSAVVDSVRSVTPAWQYVEKMQRVALAHRSAGEDLTSKMTEALGRSSTERTAFWDVVDKHEEAFATAVRVILAPGEIASATVDVVRALNETVARGTVQGQEVLIATVEDDWAGPALAAALRRLGGRLTAADLTAKPHKDTLESKSLACDLLPQSVAAVRATWKDPTTRGMIAGGIATPTDALPAPGSE
jgi:hypothetical protein